MDGQGYKIYNITVRSEDSGQRLDVFISSAIEDVSRSHAQRLIEGGFVFLNGIPCTLKRRTVEEGEEFWIRIDLPPELLPLKGEDIPLNIVYEDEDILVIDKPKGMVVHPGAGNLSGTLVNALLHRCVELSISGGADRPGIVHRLDKDSSGLMAIAKSDAAHEGLSRQIAEYAMERIYGAIVYGRVKEDEFTIDAPIKRDYKSRLKMSVQEGGRRAVTHIRVLERFSSFTYLEARLETGRTHQIRVHLAHRHHPLLGDSLYGRKKQAFGIEGQMLHSKEIGFKHPITGEAMHFYSDVPEEFESILNKLRRMV